MKEKPTYIIGHKNPDTDSIVSSIAYSEYKKYFGQNTIASRLGVVNSETEYLLERFGFEEPKFLSSAKCLIKEIDHDKANLVSKDIIIKEALEKIMKTDSKTLFVVDKDKHLEGLVSLSNVTALQVACEKHLEDILKVASIENIVRGLNGKILVKNKNFHLNGKVVISPKYENNIEEGTIVVTSNEDKIRKAIKANVGLVIYLENDTLEESLNDLAVKYDVPIICSPFSALKIAKTIYEVSPVESIMVLKDKIVTCNSEWTIDEASETIQKTRFRSYPIVDNDNKVVGALSRYHLFNYEKKKFILVDHNETKQTIDDIKEGDIVEIIDHHRIGNLETTSSIDISVMAVGATATIIANKFISNNVPISKNLAALMLGAIIADTLNFKSPTTTKIDIETANVLENISDVKADELSKEMIDACESILDKKNINIVYDDFKEFRIKGSRVGLSQNTCKELNEYLKIKEDLENYMEELCTIQGYDLLVVMLTHPDGSGSHILYKGNKAKIIEEIFKDMSKHHFVNKLVSRKNQLLPLIIEKLNKIDK